MLDGNTKPLVEEGVAVEGQFEGDSDYTVHIKPNLLNHYLWGKRPALRNNTIIFRCSSRGIPKTSILVRKCTLVHVQHVHNPCLSCCAWPL